MPNPYRLAVRRFVFLMALLALVAFSVPALATSAVATCKICTQTPCVDYCENNCEPCEGDEGDTFIFYSGDSSGNGALNFEWDYEGASSGGYTGSNTVTSWEYISPHNPNLYPNGWPAILTVTDNGGVRDDATVYVKINNVPPTAVAYTNDPGGVRQDEEVYLYVNQPYQFFGEDSEDYRYFSGTGISAYAWDFSYDGVSFIAESSNKNPWKTFTAIGDVTVRLRVRDDDTPYAEAFNNILVHVINDGPFARIIGPDPGNNEGDVPFYEGETKRFDGDSTGSAATIVKWEWDLDYQHPMFVPEVEGQTIYHAFGDARRYYVALRVTDDQSNTFITFSDYYPQNIKPTAQLEVRDVEGTVLASPYTVPEGVPLTFDASDSFPTPPDPGNIVGYQWDWNYNGFTFLPDPTATTAIKAHSWREDTDHSTTGLPYKVRLRVIDDDSNPPDHLSDDYLTVDIWVEDVLPQAEIQVCNQYGNNCAAPQTMYELPEGDLGVFKVADVGGNTDDIVGIEWDFFYDGIFDSNPAYEDLETVEFAWDSISTQTIAVMITDDDGEVSITSMDLFIVDKAPTALITPNGEGGTYTVNEGDQIVFSAEGSTIAPDDSFARFRWDESFDGSQFSPDEQHDLVSTCENLACSRFISFEDITCFDDEDCPAGRGTLPMTMPDGPSVFTIALCVEDIDNQGVCVAGADPTDAAVYPRIYTLEVHVQNVAPKFDQNFLPPEVIGEHDTLSWCPVIIEPAGMADPLVFDCNPDNLPTNMECNTANGCLSWQPGSDDVSCTVGDLVQNYSLQVCENEEGGICSTLNANIEVRNSNDPPSVTGFDGANTALSGQEYLATLYAEDPDSRCGESLFYYLCGDNLSGMVMDLNGIFRWTPSNAQVGPHNVGMCVRDDQGSEDCSVCYWQTITVAPAEEVPVVVLGEDTTLEPGRICMTGKVTSNPGDHDLTYGWRQINGPTDVCLGDFSEYPADLRACFVTSEHGSYTFAAEADNGTYSGEDRIGVTITNIMPGAIVPGDRNYEVGALVQLDGSHSNDYNLNDDTLLYQWTDWREVLEHTTVFNPSFVALEALGIGLFEFELQVDDGLLTSPPGQGFMTVEIMELDTAGKVLRALPYATFRPLVCDQDDTCEDADTTPAGEGEEFILDGSQSVGRSGNTGNLTYSWDYLEDGPIDPNWGSLVGEENQLRVTAFSAGYYTFALRVSDGNLQSRLFTRTVVVQKPTNRAPTADAGEDLKVSLVEQCPSPSTVFVEVELDGSGSTDPEQSPLNYHWTQSYGAPVPLKSDNTRNPSFYAFEPGLYGFELTVNDGNMDSRPDTVWVSVIAEGGATPFIAISHPRYNREKRTITSDPGDSVEIDASGTNHPTGKDITFEWSQISGPSVVLSSWTDSVVSFVPDLTGVTYTFRLIVWAEDGTPSIPFDLKVVVLAESNSPPECAVEDSQIETVVGNLVELNATPTRDIDANDVLTYQWKQISEDSVADIPITNADQLVASVQPTTEGSYVFEFIANDGYEDCDAVRVTVTADSNTRPVAKAGADIETCVGSQVKLDGSNSFDADGHELAYKWVISDDGGTGIATDDFTPGNDVVNPSFYAINSGLMVINLVVDDGFEGGVSEPDSLAVQIATRCGDAACYDDDDDGYFVGPDCDFDDEETPYDCDDTDKSKNAGNVGSCTDDGCIDNDFDNCCSNMEPLDPDDNDPKVTCYDDQPDGDDEGGGGGCNQSNPQALWLVLLALVAIGLRRRLA